MIAEHVEKMAAVGEIIVEVHRYTHAKNSRRSKLEKEMTWDKNYEDEVHLKSVVKGTISDGVV